MEAEIESYLHSGYEYSQIASTCLIAAIHGHTFVTVHVGDGNILSFDRNFKTTLFSKAYNAGAKNRTVFCSQYEEALHTMQLYRGRLDDNIMGFVLLSDGADGLIDDSDKLSKLIAATVAQREESKSLCVQICRSAAEGSESGDDASVAVMAAVDDDLLRRAQQRLGIKVSAAPEAPRPKVQEKEAPAAPNTNSAAGDRRAFGLAASLLEQLAHGPVTIEELYGQWGEDTHLLADLSELLRQNILSIDGENRVSLV